MTGTFTILLVDDREENLISLKELLSAPHRNIISAGSGNEALKMVLRNEIGLIMLDVQMPDMDGYEVARILKTNPQTKDIPVIFVTAINRDEKHVIQGFEEGAVDYLSKPLDMHVTRAKVAVFEKLWLQQRQLKNSMAQVQEVNKQLDRFVSIVAHDLKSPLAGIIGIISLLDEEEDINKNPAIKEYIGLVSQAAGHLSGMITSLLEYSKTSIDQQAIEKVDADDMVRQIAHLLFPPKHIHIVIKGKLPTLDTRRLKLEQVFQNLMSNAIKYNEKAEGNVEIGCEDKGDEYEFYVKDNGPGIAEKDEELIFRLFQTTNNHSKTKESSTGVGLNIVKVLVEEQGGRIWVRSQPGDGSCFFFTWKK